MDISTLAKDSRCVYAVDAKEGGRVYSIINNNNSIIPTTPSFISSSITPNWFSETGLIKYGTSTESFNADYSNGYFTESNSSSVSKVLVPLNMNGYTNMSIVVTTALPSTVTGKIVSIVAQGNGALANGGGATGCLYDLFYLSNNIYFRLYNANDSIYSYTSTGAILNIIATVKDNTSTLYINGSKVVENTFTELTKTVTSLTNTTLLNRAQVSSNYSNARLYNALIYDEALNVNEVSAISSILMRGL